MSIFLSVLNSVSKVMKAFWLFIAGVVSVGVIYYLLTGVEQGIDVLIQSGEVLESGALSVLAIVSWSFLVWYSSRTLSYIKQHKDDEIFSRKAADDMTASFLYEKHCIPTKFYQHIPRMLAFNCFVSVQVAIFHLPTFFGWSGFVMVIVVASHNLLYFSLHRWATTTRKNRWQKIWRVVTATAIAANITFLGYMIVRTAAGINVLSDPLRHTFWLSIIALVMFSFEVSAVFLFVARRKSIDARRADSSLKGSAILHHLGFNPSFNSAEAPYFRLLNATAAVAIVIYVMAIFSMPFASVMGPMAFTLLALGVLTGLSHLVTLLSIRSAFNVMIVLIVLAFVFGQWRDPYTVRLLTEDGKQSFSGRPDIKTYLSRWFEKRQPLIQDTTRSKFPIYIVLSDGGASRAGKWTTSVLTHLQDRSYRLNPTDSFKEHILCIAGASGGTVGNCAFYSLLGATSKGEIGGDEFSEHADAFFESDFLTFTLARLLGPDIFRHVLPFNITLDNRADALEKTIASASPDTLLNAYFEKPVTDVFDTTGTLPILFINTTQVDNGMPGVISNVLLPEVTQRTDVLSLIDSTADGRGRKNIRLSTAAVLSSRFPYVSPAGKVFDRYYVDGGYFDNSGAGAVLEFIQELNAFMSDSSNTLMMEYRDRLTFHLLHITNSEIHQRASHDIHPLTNDLFAPLITLAGMQGSSTDIGDGMLINTFKQFNADTTNAMIVYSLYDESWDPVKHAGKYEEGYPMSWALSDYQLHRMKAALQRANEENLSKFGY